MHSGEGEAVQFSEELYPTGNVEDWLLEVERVMKSSLRSILYDALLDYSEVCIYFVFRASMRKTIVLT